MSTSPPTCASPLGSARTSQNVTINDISFVKQVGSEAAAGSLYDWTAYSAQNGTTCVSVGFVLRSLDPAAFPTPPPQFDAAGRVCHIRPDDRHLWLDHALTKNVRRNLPPVCRSVVRCDARLVGAQAAS